MKHGFIKVAAATPRVTVADCKANGEEILKAIHEMEKEHVKLMVFPEFCITGYTCHDLFLQRCLLDSAWDELLHIADETKETDALIFVGLPLRHRGKLYNVAAALNHGRIVGFVPKTHIPNYNEFYEQRQFAGAEEEDVEFVDFLKGVKNEEDEFWDEIPFGTDLIFECEEFPEFTVAAELCEDLWVPAPPSIRHAINGAHIIVNLSASDEMVGKDSYRRTLVSGQSARLICGYIYASAGEGESTQDLVFGGQNMIAENGSMLAESRRFENGIIYSEIDVQRLADERRRMSTYPAVSICSHTRVGFSVAEEETRLTRKYPQYPFVPSVKEERDERCEEILNIQAMGLKKRMEHIHSRSAVVGLSGGLDSTLALLVCAKACDYLGIDRTHVIGVTMPGFGTTDRTYQNALTLMRCLGITMKEIPIRDAVIQHFKDIDHDISLHNVTYENAQARERTQILMDLANKYNGLVVGTGDLSELALGWATYNGDHMSMYGVNGSIPKTLVRYLVAYEADRVQGELSDVLRDVLDTPVSPELLPPKDGEISQKTEDLVGPYELHDFFLYYMLRFGYPPRKIFRAAHKTFAGVYDDATIKKWLATFMRRFFTQQFKRSCLPDGPKVGTVTLSPRGDWRMPSDAVSALWLREAENL